MTELITAEEWDQDWKYIRERSPAKRQFVRDIQRNFAEAAAKAVCNCGRCKSRGERRAADCLAEGIWELYHGIPAPAGNEQKPKEDES